MTIVDRLNEYVRELGLPGVVEASPGLVTDRWVYRDGSGVGLGLTVLEARDRLDAIAIAAREEE